MAYQLHFNDVSSFHHKPLPDSFATFKNWSKDAHLQLNHPQAGNVGVNVFALPQLQLTHLAWQTGAEEVRLHGHEKAARSIGISFQVAGGMNTRFQGINTPLPMQAGKHNLVYIPEAGDEHTFAANIALEALQINLDENFFRGCVGTEGPWAEKVLTNLETETPFSAVDGAADSTPAMQQIIKSITQLPQEVPMRNMLIQSRVIELLALQFSFFAGADKTVSNVSVADAEKLHQLKTYLDQHFLEDLSLSVLSRQFCLNEFKVKKGFRQLFDDTVFGYIRRLRMEYAMRMLRDSNTTVDDVAFELGYEHAQHFSTAFRKFFGEAPSVHIHRGYKQSMAAA